MAEPAVASTFTVYDSVDFGNEQITTLPGDNSWYVLYSVDIGTINVGDIIVVFADGGQLQDPTNTTDHYLTSRLMRATSATATTGTEIDDANAMNITQVYRQVPIKPAITTIGSGTTGRHYVNLLVQSASGSPDLNVNAEHQPLRHQLPCQSGGHAGRHGRCGEQRRQAAGAEDHALRRPPLSA